MMNTKVILALGMALSSGAVLAQSGGSSGSSDSRNNQQQNSTTQMPSATVKVDFGSLDNNTDKMLSLDEVSSNSALSEAFSGLDTDKSGGLTNAEFAKFESDGASGQGQGAASSDRAKAKGKAEKDDSSVKEKIESGND